MPGRIVIADEAVNNRIYLGALLRAASFQVFEAITGSEVERIVRKSRPDLVVIDGHLSDPGSFEICRQLKCDPATAAIQIIVLSSDFGPDFRLAALRAGADEVLPRPVSEPILRARIRNLLRIRALDNEFSEREATAAELGFAEEAARFEVSSLVCVVDCNAALPHGWLAELRAMPGIQLEHIKPATLLASLAERGRVPDVVVLPADMLAERSALTAIAELRSRMATRHSAILMAHEPEDRLSATSALDLGANDLIETDSSAKELRLRLENQLKQRSKNEKLRSTLKKGLHLAVTDPLTGLFNRRYALPLPCAAGQQKPRAAPALCGYGARHRPVQKDQRRLWSRGR